MSMSYKYKLGSIALFFLALGSLFGQATDSNVTGMVIDASGAAVVGAEVNAQNSATSVRHSAVSNSSGVYRFNNIPAGVYSICLLYTSDAADEEDSVDLG